MIHQRYEVTESGKTLFWEIWVDRKLVTTRTGKRGGRSKQESKVCPTMAAAKAEAARAMAEKAALGWTPMLDEQGAPLRQQGARNPTLEAAILRAPDDRELYLVYGDWLSEQNDPRGELVAIHAALEERPKDKQLLKRWSALHRANGRDWLGKLWGTDETAHPVLTLDWRWGFLESVAIRVYTDRYYSELQKLAVAAFLRELTIRIHAFHRPDDVVPELCRGTPPAALKTITLAMEHEPSAAARRSLETTFGDRLTIRVNDTRDW